MKNMVYKTSEPIKIDYDLFDNWISTTCNLRLINKTDLLKELSLSHNYYSIRLSGYIGERQARNLRKKGVPIDDFITE